MDCTEIGNLDFEQMAEGLGYSVLCCRNDDLLTIEYAGNLFYSSLGFKKGEITALLNNRPNSILSSDEPVDWEKVRAEIIEKSYACPEIKLIKKDGHHIWVSYRVRLIKVGGAECFCGLINDITLKRRSSRQIREQTQELKALTSNVPGGVLRCRDDEFLTLGFVSDGFCRITGYTRDEIGERFKGRFLNMVYEKDRDLLMRQINESKEEDSTEEITYRISTKNDRCIWVIDKLRRTADCNGIIWLYSVLIDVTEMKKAQDDLAISEERYRLILEYAADPVFDGDLKENRFYYSPAFNTKFGENFPKGGDFFDYLSKTQLIYEPDKERLISNLKRLIAGEKVGDIEYRFRDAEGRYIWCNSHPTVFFNRQGVAIRIIVVLSDIDKRKKETQILRKKAEHDLLTGLYNRITTTDLVENVIAHSESGSRHSMFVIDIDNFKKVNDNLGHLCGDQLIVETAEQIKKLFREDDIVGRVGGDEFVVFLRNINSLELVIKKAESLRQAFRTASCRAIGGCYISASVGISCCPYDGTSYEELFRKADAAMYMAKNSGKDDFRIYTSGIETGIIDG